MTNEPNQVVDTFFADNPATGQRSPIPADEFEEGYYRRLQAQAVPATLNPSRLR